MDKIDRLKMILFGVGSEFCEDFLKQINIGLGKPKVAFAIGFQQAVHLMYTTGVITRKDMESFINKFEESSGRPLTKFDP